VPVISKVAFTTESQRKALFGLGGAGKGTVELTISLLNESLCTSVTLW